MLVNYVPRVPNAADFAYQGGVPVCIDSTTGDLYVMLTGVAPYNTIHKVPALGGTVTSVAALTIGTTGTDLSSSVANGTTTAVLTLNVPTASAANRGALSAANWSTFNAKQAAISFGTGVLTALGVNVGSAGSPVLNGGALGTPSSGTGTNITGVNAATLGGATFAAPGAIGGGTPAAISGTTGLFTSRLKADAAETDTINPGGDIGSIIFYGGYANIRMGTDHSLNIDTYNSNSQINVVKVAQNGAVTFTKTIRPGGYTVGTLPAGTIGMKAYVTDALAPAFLVLLAAGGAAYSGAQYSGSQWVGD